MALKCFFSSVRTSAVAPSITDWVSFAGSPESYYLARCQDAAEVMTNGTLQSWNAGETRLDRQFVSDPLAAQTISGTILAQLSVREVAADDNVRMRLKIYVVDRAGTTVRGVLYPLASLPGSQAEINLTARNIILASGHALTPVNALAGDRLVVEVGFFDVAGTTPQARSHWGRPFNVALLTQGNQTETGLLVGWIEFSQDILFEAHHVTLNRTLEYGLATQIPQTLYFPVTLNRTLEFGLVSQMTGPRVVSRSPEGMAPCFLGESSSVGFRLFTSLPQTLNLTTIVVRIQVGTGASVVAYDGSAGGFQTGYSGSVTNTSTSLQDSRTFVITPAAGFAEGAVVSVTVSASDDLGASIAPPETWSFFTCPPTLDLDPPFVADRFPDPGSTNVPVTAAPSFLIDDAGEGVDLATIQVSVTITVGTVTTTTDVVINGVIQAPWAGSITPESNGYRVELTPPEDLEVASYVSLSIDAEDTESNAMATSTYFFYTPFQKPVCSFAECRVTSLLGSVIQLDGRPSYSPDGAALTYQWKFIQVPQGSTFESVLNTVNPAAFKDLRPSTRAAVSFIPDKLGDYLVQLVVVAGPESSDGCTALVEIGLSRALCGAGKVPDASFMWAFLSNFWALVEDRQYLETIWSGQMQILGAEYIKLWSNDYNKSLDTIQNTVQRRWQRFVLHTDLSAQSQRVIVGNTLEGTTGITGEIGAPGSDETNILHSLLSNQDFTIIDINYGAKGRIIDINGEAFTISRVFNTQVGGTDYSVVVLDEEAVTDGQSGIPYRIPHMIHVPLFDLEEEGVRAGDTLVLEWTRGDTGVSAEMSVRVVAADRERIGFEFTVAELDPGDETLDYALFEQLVQDLKIVSSSATSFEIAAAANALIAFIPPGINLTQRPFSVFQITVKAAKIIHNSARKIDDLYVSIPHLQEEVKDDPDVILRENFDYAIEDGYLVFSNGLFSADDPAPEELWAECAHIDNTPTIEANFGTLVGLKSDDLVTKATRAPYLAAVKGLWFALTNGPTVANVRLGLQILMGLPFSEARGKILDITANFSTDSYGKDIGRILAEDVDDEGRGLGIRRFYFYPEDVGIEDNPLTGAPYAVGEVIEAFQPLSKGVEVTDYVKDPLWWIRTLANNEVKKFFLFKAKIDTESGVFNEKDLVFSLEFIRRIKPIYTDVVAAVLRALDDDVLGDLEDDLLDCGVLLRFYDNVGAFGAHESTVRSDDLNHQGIVLWRGSSRPFSTRTLHLLRDVVTTQSGSSVRAASATGFGSIRARSAGSSTTPTIEGDILVILPKQAGAGASAPRMYEITSATLPNGPLVLGNEVSAAEPTTLDPTAPVAALFDYGTDLRVSIVRRGWNPVVRGTDLVTATGSVQLASSATAAFQTNGVAIDDHLIIESGANAGEYRIVSIVAQSSPRDYTPAGVPQISNTQVGLVSLAGANPSLTNLTGQSFRVVRPAMMLTRVEGVQIIQTGGNMWAQVLDPVTSFPFDVFTPGMVGAQFVVQNAQNPLNNGTYTILAYSHAGLVRITTGSPQTSDSTAVATGTIRSSYHSGFQKAEELAPTEVFSAAVS